MYNEKCQQKVKRRKKGERLNNQSPFERLTAAIIIFKVYENNWLPFGGSNKCNYAVLEIDIGF